MKVVFATPTVKRPDGAYLESLEASIPLLDKAGIKHQAVFEIGCPYISSARATLLRKALDAEADVVIFIDHDLSWPPDALLRLIETEGDVVAATYRFRIDEERYMGVLKDGLDHRPVVRDDGCLKATLVPAGFLKVTREAVHRFMGAYPELIFGPRFNPLIDLFNHGARDGLWWGEDYAFSRNWCAMGGELWILPDIDITHHNTGKDGEPEAFPGNFHKFLMRQPGGRDDPDTGKEENIA